MMGMFTARSPVVCNKDQLELQNHVHTAAVSCDITPKSSALPHVLMGENPDRKFSTKESCG